MDLVNIGFIVHADSLKEANQQLDQLLTKAEKLGKRGKQSGEEAAKGQDSNRKAVDRVTQAMEKQVIISQLLNKGIDKGTATTLANFKLMGASLEQMKAQFAQIKSNDAFVQATKDAQRLREEIAATAAQAEKERQKRFAAEQKYYQQQMALASSSASSKEAAEEKARQKRFKAEQAEYQRQMKLLADQKAAELKTIADTEKNAEVARQKRFKAEQAYYQRQMALIENQRKAEARNLQQQQKSIELIRLANKYRQEGLSATNSNKMASMELRGADVQTLQAYKKALLESQNATQRLGDAHDTAAKKVGFFNTQVGGIIKYALLSTAIYGAITATLGLGVAIVSVANEYTSIQNRMKLYVSGAEELSKVNAHLAQTAIATNVGLRETATLYTRLAPAMKAIGGNTAATLKVVDSFTASMRIGGATTAEAASATLQFSQAMSSGKLAGDEFRAIAEASPRFMKAIADGIGKTTGELKAMGSAGELTTEVISKALLKEYPKLIEENKKLGVSLDQGATAIKTAFTVMVGEFNEGSGASAALGNAMMDLAQSMLTVGNNARETGKSVQEWFKDNAKIISGVATAVEILAIAYVSKLVVGFTLARIESMRYTATLLAMQAAQDGVSKSSLLAATAMTTLGNAAKTALGFFGGWVGLGLTVVATVAAYAMFNKASAQTADSLLKEGQSVDAAIAKYKELSHVKQLSQLDAEKQNMKALQGAYKDAQSELANYASTLNRSSDYTNRSQLALKALFLEYQKTGNIDKFVDSVRASGNISEDAKAKVTELAGKVVDTGNAAKETEKFVKALGDATELSGEQAAIAGNKFDKFVTDLNKSTKVYKSALQISKAYGLDQAHAMEAAKQHASLKEQGKFLTMGQVKALQAEQAAQEAFNNSFKEATKAEKERDKERKKQQRYKDKYETEIKELETYYSTLKAGQSLEVAKVASQKEYIKAFGTNLAIAKEIAALQESTRQEESRVSFEKSLRTEEELQERIVKLMKLGADYDSARNLAQAEFTDDLRGRQALELDLTNKAYAQNLQLASQADAQKGINEYLAKGLSLEEATFRVQMSRINALAKNPKQMDDLEAAYAKNLLILQARKAEGDALIKINDANRMTAAFTNAIAKGYDRARIAVAALVGSTVGLSKAKAAEQIAAQETATYAEERVKNQLEISALLSGEDETVRAILASYSTLDSVQVGNLTNQRKAVALAKEYADYLEAQKKTPIGDFGSVDFSVFGDYGNPFKDALDGVNNYVAALKTLDDNLHVIQETRADLTKQLEAATTAEAKLDITGKLQEQIDLEKHYSRQKQETNDIAYGEGLKFAKSFFKENSKGYKTLTVLEQVLQAKKIAFALWEKKDTLTTLALKVGAAVKSAAAAIAGATSEMAAQGALNTVKAIGAVLTQGSGDPYTAFARMAAMAAVVAGLGVAIGSVTGGSSSNSLPASNDGSGTVFGGAADAKSESILKAMDILANNSDLNLPISAAMLKSLQNIEAAMAGVANLVIRNGVGTELASNVSTGFSQSSIGKGLQAAGNTFLASVGDFLGFNKMLGSLLGGLFGTKTTITGQGLAGFAQSLGTIMDEGFALKEYIDVQTKKKKFGITTSTSNSSRYSDASEELANQFTLIFANINDSILKAAPVLGANLNTVTKALNDYVVNIGRIDLKGLDGEAIQEKLNNVFSAEADKIAQAAVGGLDAFQKIGEGYFETLLRVAGGIDEANYYTSQLHVTAISYTEILNKQGDVAAELVRQSVLATDGISKVSGGFYDLVNNFSGTAEEIATFVVTLRDLQESMYVTGQSGNYLTAAMINGAGGLDGLKDGLSAYFDMLSASEQATELTRRMTNEFALLGLALPSNVDAFKALVGGIDLTTEAGQKLYGQVLALAPEFADMMDAVTSVQEEAAKAAKEAADAVAKAEQEAADAAQKLADEAAKAAEEAQKLADALAASIKEARKYTDSLRIVAVSYDSVANKAGDAATEILRASMLAYLGSTKLAGGFYDLVSGFEGSANELYTFIKAMREAQVAIYVTGQNAKNITDAMLKGSDGIDNLNSGLSAFFDTLSNTAKAEELTRRMTNQFAELGYALPSNIEAFQDLVRGVDTSTASGQELFGRLIMLTSGFVGLQDALKTVQDEAQAAADEAKKLADEALQAAEEAAKAAAEAAAEAAKAAAELEAQFKTLRTAFYITGQNASYVTQTMMDAAGGFDALKSGLDAMFEMLSPTEQATELTRRLTEQFASLGLTLPTSTDAFRALVAGIDGSTASGQALLGQIIALAPEFNTLQDALSSAQSEVNALVQSLRDLAGTATNALGETDQTKNLALLRNQFQADSLLAIQGDTDAANRLLSLGQSLMDVSKQYSTSGSEYARDLAMIINAANLSANAQEASLGYTVPSLTTAGASSNTALETTNTTTDAKLEELRSDMLTAIAAVAKYTQDTAKRLERWDDGDRMNVRVEQDSIDSPLRVTNV